MNPRILRGTEIASQTQPFAVPVESDTSVRARLGETPVEIDCTVDKLDPAGINLHRDAIQRVAIHSEGLDSIGPPKVPNESEGLGSTGMASHRVAIDSERLHSTGMEVRAARVAIDSE
eukprot:3113577-Amphidinium_carterae.1